MVELPDVAIEGKEMDIDFLKECLLVEVIGSKEKRFTWARAIRHAWRQPKRRFLFWWRIASYLYHKESRFAKRLAAKINRNLMRKYGAEVELGAFIDTGLYIGHYNGVAISQHAHIGKNFTIRQNTTIGVNNNSLPFTIGDNVNVGAHSCILSKGIVIGDNVTIGAFSFINKDIPSNCVCYTKRENVVIEKGIEE